MENFTPLVSIIIPVYNSRKYVHESIHSIIAQTFTSWELIIVDDCSIDGTYDYLLEKYASNSKIKVLRNEINSGAGVTRNLGLENASGRLIAFLDADDLWLPQKLEKQLAFMAANNSAIVHTSYSFIDERGDNIPGHVDVSEYVNLRSYMRNTEIGMSTSLINKDIVGEFRLHSMRTRQDTRLWLGLLSEGHIANGLNEDLVLYRVRKGQISGNKVIIAWRTLKVYLSITDIALSERLINYCYYAFNGVIKRFKK
ncbi:MAG: teichuronic acid biosynthesis glycosyltransferase TuaG [Marinobacter maritimus]|jgi:teichuronic acid biosynthesis glycosyltransferase TuaG